MTPPKRSNPYCDFKDDQQRRLALRSRDVRLVVIAALGTASAAPIAHVWPWLLSLFHK
ncbi:MAG TPA: hypothetical protein VF457_09220 [Burkholderiaceae bacterium]